MNRNAGTKSKLSNPLVYPAGCAELKDTLSKEELIKRLKDLFLKFQDFEQDDDSNEKFKPLANYLASKFFVDHADREVRMFTACILADAMRIFAPNAPFSDRQLKEVLHFFVKQMGAINSISSPVFRHAFYLLDIVSSTRLFCAYLNFEEECPAFFCKIFECVLNSVTKEHADNVKNIIIELCIPLLQEAPVITTEMIECLFSRLIEPSKSGNPTAYKLVLDIIVKTKELEYAIADYFRTPLLSGTSDNSSLSKSVYAILYELCIHDPDVVHSILSNFVRDALELHQEPLRLAAVRFCGQLFSRPSGVGALFAFKYPLLWAAYLGRSKDYSVVVRTNWVKQALAIVNALTLSSADETDMCKAIFDRLITRALDVDAQVRLDVIDVTIALCQSDLSRVPDDLLSKIVDLTRDKHARTRSSAVLALGKIYRRVCIPLPTDKNLPTEPSKNDDTASDSKPVDQKSRICWIRNEILHLYCTSGLLEDRALVERVLYACLVPVTSLDLSRRLEELVSLYNSLDDVAIKCFEQLVRFQAQLRDTVHRWAIAAVGRGEETEGAVVASQGSQLQVLSHLLPGDTCPAAVLAQLDRMLTSNKHLAERLKLATDIRCSSTKASELANEIVKMVSADVGKQKSSQVITAVKFILERTLPLLIAGPSFAGLLRIVLQFSADFAVNQSPKTAQSIVSTLRLANLVASHFKSSCLQIDPVLVQNKHEADNVKYVLDLFVSLFDQLLSLDALALVAQTLPHLLSPSFYQNQSSQFHMTLVSLQTLNTQLAKEQHVALAKRATICLVYLMPPTDHIRILKPIVDLRISQISSVLKKLDTVDGMATSTLECTPDDSPPSSKTEVDIQPAIVGFYSLGRLASLLPKSFFNDMRGLAMDTCTWLDGIKARENSSYPTLRVAGLKFIARWLSSLRQDQSLQGTVIKRTAECIAGHIALLMPREDGENYNKDLVLIGQAAASSCFRLMRSSEAVFMTLPASVAISLGQWMAVIDVKTLRVPMRDLFVKLQSHVMARQLPPLALAVFACAFVSADKELRSTMQQIITKLVSAWRMQVQFKTPSLLEAPRSDGTTMVPLQKLADSLLPCFITLLSFITVKSTDHLEYCRQAIRLVFEILTNSPNGANTPVTRAASEHLPLCRGFISKLKSAASSSIDSAFSSVSDLSLWSEKSLMTIINLALAEMPAEKGKTGFDSLAQAVDIEPKRFWAVMGPLCELFHGKQVPKITTVDLVHSSVPLSESVKNNVLNDKDCVLVSPKHQKSDNAICSDSIIEEHNDSADVVSDEGAVKAATSMQGRKRKSADEIDQLSDKESDHEKAEKAAQDEGSFRRNMRPRRKGHALGTAKRRRSPRVKEEKC